MGIEDIRRLKAESGEPAKKKYYKIAKISPKRQIKREMDKAIIAADKEFYKKVWAVRNHVCENCGCPLGKEMKFLFFHHLLPKIHYPLFRHDPRNIMLLCLEDHSKAETNIDFAPKIKERALQAELELLNQ
jgi:hypothetical protein